MAPTTLSGQKTTTTPYGREDAFEGSPLKISEMLALVKGVKYIERCAVNSPANIRKTKKAIMKAFQVQIDKLGFSDGGNTVSLSHQLEDEPPGVLAMGGAGNDKGIPPGNPERRNGQTKC